MKQVRIVLAIAAVAGATTVLARQTTQPDKVQAQPVMTADAMRGPDVPAGAKWDLRLQTPVDSGDGESRSALRSGHAVRLCAWTGAC